MTCKWPAGCSDGVSWGVLCIYEVRQANNIIRLIARVSLRSGGVWYGAYRGGGDFGCDVLVPFGL